MRPKASAYSYRLAKVRPVLSLKLALFFHHSWLGFQQCIRKRNMLLHTTRFYYRNSYEPVQVLLQIVQLFLFLLQINIETPFWPLQFYNTIDFHERLNPKNTRVNWCFVYISYWLLNEYVSTGNIDQVNK